MGTKVIHMGGGLGNQMASYPMYLGIKQANPDDDIFTETYIFDIEEVNADCSMWNGYELQKVFGIEIPDVRDKFPVDIQKEQIEAIRKDYQITRDYNVSFCKVMKNYGIKFGEDSYKDMYLMSKCRHNIFTKSSFGWWGAYLNDNPDKITICQRSPYISTVQF